MYDMLEMASTTSVPEGWNFCFELIRNLNDYLVPIPELTFNSSLPASRSCEKTMLVMHRSQEALLTILRVLLYDPLCDWTISPEKAYLLQQLKENLAGDTSAAGGGDILTMEDRRTNNSKTKRHVTMKAQNLDGEISQKFHVRGFMYYRVFV